MFPFDFLEKIREPKVFFLIFSVGWKRKIGRLGLKS